MDLSDETEKTHNPDTIEAKEETFKNIAEVADFLHRAGWKCGKRTVYNHANRIRRQHDGTFSERDVLIYARKFLHRLDGTTDDVNSAEKLRWEIEILKQKAENARRGNEINSGLYVLKTDIEHMLAARAAYLKDSLGASFIHSQAAKIIDLVQGNQSLTPDLVQFWMNQIAETFDYYSQPLQFEARYTPAEGDDEGSI